MSTGTAKRNSWNRPIVLRLSIRGLIVLVLAIAVGLGWVEHGARVQREAVAAIVKSGGRVDYNGRFLDGVYVPDDRHPWPGWITDHVEIDYLATVTQVRTPLGADRRSVDETMAAVGRLGRLESLFLGKGSNDADLAHLRGNPRLKQLVIGDSDHLTGAGLAHLEGLTQLEVLRYPRARISDADLAHLSNVTHLQRLELVFADDSKAGDAGLARLSTLKELRDLRLYNARNVTNEGLAHLGELTRLENLSLNGARVTDLKGLAPLVGLKSLWLMEVPIDDAGLAALANLSGLQHLYLTRDAALTDAGLAWITSLKELVNLDLRECQITDASLALLQGCPKLEYLYLAGTNVGDEGLSTLVKHKRYALIDVAKSRVTPAGVVAAMTLRPGQAIHYP